MVALARHQPLNDLCATAVEGLRQLIKLDAALPIASA
jgi:hypothetical protein